jgi:glycosyltransferase involved in cell wall biosynthesis
MGWQSCKIYKKKIYMSKQKIITVTVITVTYNAEKYIDRTILSVINQKNISVELIIIDGKSTDSTLDIVSKYKDNISCIISEADKGIFDAMNKGIIHATGDWINFMNAGDILVDDFVLSKMFSDSHSDIAVLYGNNVFRNKIDYAATPITLSYGYIMACHQSMFFNRNLLGTELNYKNTIFKYACEYELLARINKLGFKFKFLPVLVCNYADGGISTKLFWKVRIPKYYWLMKYYGIQGYLNVIKEKLEITNTNSYRYYE